MNKNTVGIIITVVAIAAAGGIIVSNQQDNSSKTSNQAPGVSHENSPMSADTTKTQQPAASNEVQSGTVTMDIKDFDFAKQSLKIKKGTKVIWTNQDSARHDITPDSESAAFKPSELLDKGESYEFTFDTVGRYTYKCSPHPYMKASVEVVE